MKLLGGVIIGSILGATLAWLLLPSAPQLLEVSSPKVVSRLVEDTAVPQSGYPSKLAAVIAASDRYNADSIVRNREHVGAILKCKGHGYFYTHGVGADHQAPVEFTVAKPKRCDLVALWHTHGAEASDRDFFSPADTESADRLGVPIYMTNHTGKLKMYRPGQRKIGRRKNSRFGALPMPRGTAEGVVVKHRGGEPVAIRTS